MEEIPSPVNLAIEAGRRAPLEAAEFLAGHTPSEVVAALDALNPMVAQQIIGEADETTRAVWLEAAGPEKAAQWTRNQTYPEDSLGRLMVAPVAVFRPHMTVTQAVEALRKMARRSIVTYGYVTDEQNRLLGILVMRELLLAPPDRRLDAPISWSMMLRRSYPFSAAPVPAVPFLVKPISRSGGASLNNHAFWLGSAAR